MAPPTSPLHLLLFLPLLLLSSSTSAKVPPSETFSYSNSGEFGPYIAEYSATYRLLPIASSPFQLCFFNTTPSSFFLALRLGTPHSESIFRFVWTANPSRPVADNAVFSLLADGDLRLTDADGSLVFSSKTAGKDVKGLRLLPNGNIVLLDTRGSSLWQSFEHPADTLLVGQSLNVDKKLVSRLGGYSLAAESGGLALYMNKITGGKPLLYSTGDGIMRIAGNGLKSVIFRADPQANKENEIPYAYELGFKLEPNLGSLITGRPKYNGTLSFIRIEEDGNLIAYTFYSPVDYQAWERVFIVFSSDIGWENHCRLPSTCGAMGICAQEMCVACPEPPGQLAGWSEHCAPPTAAEPMSCEKRTAVAEYYKVVGVESFVNRYGESVEGVDVGECRGRCDLECGCLGVLYWEKERKCWLAWVIGTLEKVGDESHVAWIKYYK
ncbi:hypothetical protein IEQ34_002995 [Dendrobium chrysotoxum]|uniref:Bulb-type lectin domain-containing protein n=1 Tax=Dendrobium chrysotoxum TaxID=161865 RepID=A0AAV7HI36_DENCH|nr:hypothetical protein IEQ34_002995 [Dendrobium chrysotoxum]